MVKQIPSEVSIILVLHFASVSTHSQRLAVCEKRLHSPIYYLTVNIHVTKTTEIQQLWTKTNIYAYHFNI